VEMKIASQQARSFGADGMVQGPASGKFMLITPDRICYAGLLGRPLTREFGALTLYVSLGSPLSLKIRDGAWQSGEMFVVQADTPHQVATVDRRIGVYMIEPESVDLAQLPPELGFLATEGGAQLHHPAIREAFLALAGGDMHINAVRTRLDEFILGARMPVRQLECRVAAVVNRIKRNPSDSVNAEDYAQQVDLSFSRFLHLFKEEVGTTFRRFRAWKRARNFMCYVNANRNLTDIALETGYPDSSHFSHTVRRYWGLTPKDIMAGSRTLAVIHDASLVSTAH
jgi:AraC-like DNA-binding protein